MADDDENKPKKHTFESLYLVYCNYVAYPMDIDNESYETILLSQIDAWLDQAKLLKTEFTQTETGLIYMKFKKWRLTFDEFIELLDTLCVSREMKLDDLKELMVEAGAPGGAEVVAVK